MSLPIFPYLPTMAWNSIKRQRWNTKMQKSGSGIRKTLSRWAYPEWEIECEYTSLSVDNRETVAGFFNLVKGQYQPFLWKDPEDYREINTRIGMGTGTSQELQLLKNFGGLYVEPVKDIITGTLNVYADGVKVSASLGIDGLVVVTAPEGAIITASFEYYWRVAFTDDDLEHVNFWYSFYKLKKIKLVTVK